MLCAMAEVIFLPHYAEVLEGVLRQAVEQGVIEIECRPDVDPAVVAHQLGHFAASQGRALRCLPGPGHVEVRCEGTTKPRPRSRRPAARGA
jgi:hypothetical protein